MDLCEHRIATTKRPSTIGSGRAAVLKYTKSLLSSSKHTVRFEADGEEKDLVLSGKKAVAFSIVEPAFLGMWMKAISAVGTVAPPLGRGPLGDAPFAWW